MSKHRNKSRSTHKPASARPQQPASAHARQPANTRAVLAAAFGVGLIVVSAVGLWWMARDTASSAAAPLAPATVTAPVAISTATASAPTTVAAADAPAANPAALPVKRVAQLNQLPAGKAERVEVAYFHRTQRCVSCQEAERLIRKTLATYFTDQVTGGAIHLAVTDVQKPESAAVAGKYRAAGSSLYFGIIKDGVEYICPINDVWYVLGDEARFLPVLRDRINAALGEG